MNKPNSLPIICSRCEARDVRIPGHVCRRCSDLALRLVPETRPRPHRLCVPGLVAPRFPGE